MNDTIVAPVTEPTVTPPVVETPPSPESLLGKDLVPPVVPPVEGEVKPPEPEVAPEPFDLAKVTLPENLTIPDEIKGQLTEIAGKHGLKAEAASELLALHAKVAQEAQAASTQAWYDTQSKWVGEVKSDPMFAGEKLQQAQSVIASALDEYGTPEVRAAFDLTGAGSNPAIFRTFYKMAQALSEGKAANGGTPPGGQKSLADTFYPNLANKG